MRYSSRNKRKYIIIGLCFVLLLMIVGYASFSTVLTINSSSEITSTWDVEITNVRGVNDSSLTYNDAYDKLPPSISESKLSVTIQTGLLSPGDTRIYEIEVSNLGNLDSEITTSFQNKINDSTLFTYDGVSPVGSVGTDILTSNGSYNPSLLETEEPFFIPAFTNNKRYIYLTIKYKDSVTSQPKDLNPYITLTLDVKQKSHNSSTSSFGVETVEKGGVEIPIVNSGDGLYEDSYESGRYIYRGSDPDNYLTFNGETAGWRIIAFENDGTIKVVRNSNVANMVWDEKNNRSSSISTYCTNASSNGCNAWAATSSILNTNGQNISNIFALYGPNGGTTGTAYSGTVIKASTLNTWLNGEYLNNSNNNASYLGADKQYIVNHDFYINTPGNTSDTETIGVDTSQEKLYKWNGKIGLIQVTDYMKVSTNSSCTSIYAARQASHPCGIGNYLKPSGNYWSISPLVDDTTAKVFVLSSDGNVSWSGATNSYGVHPSFYLSSNINLQGEGTSTSPYEIRTS